MSKINLRYQFFDFDDNILKTDTTISILSEDGLKDVSTEEYARLMHDIENTKIEHHDKSFHEFSDDGPRGDYAFHQDATVALNNKNYSASFLDLIDCIKGGHLFAIVTARSHSVNTLKKWFRFLIEFYLTDEEKKEMIANLNKYCEVFGQELPEDYLEHYLNKCYFYPVSNPELNLPKQIEEAKRVVVEKLVNNIYDYYLTVADKVHKVKIGFSDDSKSNIEKVTTLFKSLKERYKPIKFYIFDTSLGIKIKHKI